MSTIQIEVTQIESIKPHPNADRLEIATIMGTESAVVKDKYKAGETVLWFPPGLLIPPSVGEGLEVATYLKHARYPGDPVSTKCRVAAARVRSYPSYGFVASIEDAKKVAKTPPPDPDGQQITFDYLADTSDGWLLPGSNVDRFFGASKYEPPPAHIPGVPRPKGFNGDAARDNERFHGYTDIENYYRCKNLIATGELVRITEKIHGSNSRMGLVEVQPETSPGRFKRFVRWLLRLIGSTAEVERDFEFVAGSHHVNWKQVDSKGNVPLWWQLLTEPVANLLTDLCDEQHSVVIFGELYGPGIQDMDYGVDEALGYRAFDISVDRRYLDWADLKAACEKHGVELAPLLYEGPFSAAILAEHGYGPTTLAAEVKSKFKGREGCVVTPLVERIHHNSRVILKFVNADYLDRKGAQDN